MPKISVIIPVYNQERFLSKCLDSVLNQDLEDIEIICVDDGSTDSTYSILQSYASKDARVKILRQENKFAGSARNLGLSVASGEYIHFLDSDDYLFPNIYKKIYHTLKENNLEMVKFRAKVLDDETRETQIHNWTELVSIVPKDQFNKVLSFKTDAKLLISLPDTCWSGMYSLEFLKRNNKQFNEFRVANDTSFFIQCIVDVDRLMILDEYVVYWRTNVGTSLMDNRIKYYECQLKSYLTIADICKKIPEKQAKLIMNQQFEALMYWLKKWNEELENTEKYDDFKNTVSEFLKSLDLSFLNKKVISYWWCDTYCIFVDNVKKDMPLFGYFKFKTYNKIKYTFILFGIKLTLSRKIKRGYKYYKRLNKRRYKKELEMWYQHVTGNFLNLKHPETINEKIQWMKLYDSTPLKSRLTDKYAVRDFIKEKIGEKYLIPNLGVWDKFDDIDFDKLPNQFVLKGNHGCGCNIIVKDKSTFDKEEARKKFKTWLKTDYAFTNGFELHYSAIKPKIIAEKYIEAVDQAAIDYKFICCDGKPILCWVTNKYLTVHKRGFYSLPDWTLQNIELKDGGAELDTEGVPRPQKLDEMIEIAKTLSKGFPLVRVDLYLIENDIYFGEMTFTSASGAAAFYPDKWNYILGDKITLPEVETKKRGAKC